jgi:hypothetical protein
VFAPLGRRGKPVLIARHRHRGDAVRKPTLHSRVGDVFLRKSFYAQTTVAAAPRAMRLGQQAAFSDSHLYRFSWCCHRCQGRATTPLRANRTALRWSPMAQDELSQGNKFPLSNLYPCSRRFQVRPSPCLANGFVYKLHTVYLHKLAFP